MEVQELRKSVERKVLCLVALLISSNAYFVQRVIGSVDSTTAQVSALKEQVARIDAKLEDLREFQKAQWKRL